MDSFKKFVQDNYKLIIPIIFMVVLFVTFITYYTVSVNSNYKVDKEEEVYQYYFDKKYEYKAMISKNRKDVIVDIKPIDVKVNYDSTPVYLRNGKVVIFPADMSVVMPTISCAEYSALKYSYITFKKSVYTLTANRYNNRLNHYFLFDGEDLYFFIEDVTLKIGNEEIKLSPYSYVISKYKNYVSYYDKRNDVYKTIKVTNDEIIVSNDYYKILVDKDSIDYQGTNVILTSNIKNLNTIDKKDR